MKEEDVLKINVDTITEEEAHVLAVNILKEDIDRDKAVAKRGAIVAAILSAGLLLVGKDAGFVSYALMGVDSMSLINTFTKIADLFEKRKKLRTINSENYDGSYIDFIKKTQDYIRAKTPQVDLDLHPKK